MFFKVVLFAVYNVIRRFVYANRGAIIVLDIKCQE